ncbi:MAG: family 20 glycosylhydrolase [Saprospiraceae bacterium]
MITPGPAAIIPRPQEINQQEGYFTFKRSTSIQIANAAQSELAQSFADHFQNQLSWSPKIVETATENSIQLIQDNTLAAEAYHLNISPEKIQIKAATEAGFFYGFQSLRQLMPTDFYGKTAKKTKEFILPIVQIQDKPAFGWRGFMLDVSRHFFTVAQVKEVLDKMAELKLNRFHWHLADDQGWRVEIKAYPKLTEVGAWRMDYNNTDERISDWWGRPTQKPGEEATYGGFYTQEEIKDIVAYAKERHIEVIPEIDMPGHAQATIAAYPELGGVNAAPYVATGGVFKNNTYNPGKEATYDFIDKMLNEVMDLFPYEYVHIGGDECNKEQWKIDPAAQAKMKAEGLKNEAELQSYFIKRVEKIINARNKKMIGWDEILEGGLAPNATVMSWRGEEGGITAAKAGHEVIMTPSKYCYIDLKQGHDDLEPNLGYSQLLLSTAYNYKVKPDSLNPEEAALIKGTQANLWTESISDWSKLTYMTYPRVFAIAENAWTEESVQGWNDFTERMFVYLDRLDAQNIRYAPSAFSPWIDHQGTKDGIEISMHTEVNDLDIYYTIDGSDPTEESMIYDGPFYLLESLTIKAQSYRGGKPIGRISTLNFPVHLAANVKATDEKGNPMDKLSDLSYGKLHISDPHWQKAKTEMTTILAFPDTITASKLTFNALRFTISGVYPPKLVDIWASKDGERYELVMSQETDERNLIQGRNKVPMTIDFQETELQYLKVRLTTHPILPEGHHRAEQAASMAIDELQVW